jgi:hypothetical protein
LVALPYDQAVRKVARELLANANLTTDKKYGMISTH